MPLLIAAIAPALLFACTQGEAGSPPMPHISATEAEPSRAEEGRSYRIEWDGRTLIHEALGVSITVPHDWDIVSAAEREAAVQRVSPRTARALGISDAERGALEADIQALSRSYFTAFWGWGRSAGITCMVMDQSALAPADRHGEREYLTQQVAVGNRMGGGITYGPVIGTTLGGIPCHRVRSFQGTPQGRMTSEEYCLVRGGYLLHLGVLWKTREAEGQVTQFLADIAATAGAGE